MKVYFRTPAISRRLSGWARFAGHIRSILDCTMVLEIGKESLKR
jgi:hypothetical protein